MKIIDTLRLQLRERAFPRWHFLVAGSLLVALVYLLHTPADSEVAALDERPTAEGAEQANEVMTPLIPQSSPVAFDDLDLSTEAPSQESPLDPHQNIQIVRKGDNLSALFQRAGLNNKDLAEVTETCKEAKNLKQLQPGHKLTFTLDEKGVLQKFDYAPDLLETQSFTRDSGKFVFASVVRKPELVTKVASAQIKSSLYEAGKSAQISDLMVMELAKIFAYDIDFALDLRRGDSFKLVYQESLIDGKRVSTGQILAAEFTNDGTTYQAVRYLDKNGDSAYFSPDGRALRKGFLRTPVEFSRISSEFSLGRLHPILNKIRAHKGTDYSAPTGTPIHASGDGKITLAGIYSGYGNCVIIQHDQTYTTVYGHMSRFAQGIHKGSSVKQGEVIGYVGQTGLATGPHLHYEFHINGNVVNPMTVALPKAQPIARSEMARFVSQTQPLVAQLAQTAVNPVAANAPANAENSL